jgi:hypothetical protein
MDHVVKLTYLFPNYFSNEIVVIVLNQTDEHFIITPHVDIS